MSPILSTHRTELEFVSANDFEELLQMYLEPDTFKYIPHLQNKTKEEYRNWLEKKISQNHKEIGFYWVARLKETGELVGAMNLNQVPETDMIQIGFQIRRKFWNQGFASELARRILKYGLEERKLKTIYGIFEKENVASGRVLEKLGFQFHDRKIAEVEQVEIYKFEAKT